MKNLKRILALALAVMMLVGIASFTACSAPNPAANNEKIKIGLTGPLTGGAAMYGNPVKIAAQIAVDEINAQGGLNGIMFELVMHDDKHDPTLVPSFYADLYEKGMQVSLGTVTTAPGLNFKTLSKEDNVFFLTPSATGDLVPEFANGYQMCFADSNQGTVAAEFFNENYVGKKVGVFYKSDDPYSKGIRDNFVKTLAKSFKADLVEAEFTGDGLVFGTQINTLKNCDIVFMPIYSTPATQFMTQSKDVENTMQVFYGCDGFDGIEAVENFDINAIKQEVSYLSHFNSNATTGPAADFIAKYNATPESANYPLNQFGAAAYDCVYAIYEAMKVAVADGKEITATISASDLCEILKEVFNSDDFVFHGITGECIGDEKSDITWNNDGTVNKVAIKYVVKEYNA